MGSKDSELEWKDFFGSSVSLAPSLISIYDKKIKETILEKIEQQQVDPRKRPSSIRSNDSSSSSSSSSKPSKKKMAPSGRRLVCRGYPAEGGGDYSATLDGVAKVRTLGTKVQDPKKSEGYRRSKSVENGMRLKKEESFNAFLVCREIMETEKIYVRDLMETIKGYKKVMESRSNLFDPEEVEVLFGNIEDIYEFHCELLKEMTFHDKNMLLLCDTFVNNTNNFKIYSHYCTNYPRSQKVVMMMMSEEVPSLWLQERQTQLDHKLPLSSYLLKPVQRILKYHLLFQNLLKSFEMTSDDLRSPEFLRASAALDCMSSVARYINEMKRMHDKNIKIKEILNLLFSSNPNFDLDGLGGLIVEDKFQFGMKSLQHLLLFERQILICKWKDNCSLQVKVQIPCSNLMLVETISKSPLSFSIHPFTDPNLLFTIQAKNPEQKSLWCHEIRKVILGNFGAHIPDRARNIVMNLTPEIITNNHQIEDKNLGQIEWRKSSRRCSVAIVPDIRQPVKNSEMCSSVDNYSCLEDKQKHLPLSQSLFSVIDEPPRTPVPFSTSSSALTSTPRPSNKWSRDHGKVPAFRSLGTLDKSHTIDSRKNSSTRREGRTSLMIFKRNSSVDDSLSTRCDDDDIDTLSEGGTSGETIRCSNPERPCSDGKANIPQRTESFHDSSIHSAPSSRSTLKNTFLNLKDKFKKRSHSTDNRHYRSTPKLQGYLEERSEVVRRGPSRRLVSRFALSGKKSKSSLDEDKHVSPLDESCYHHSTDQLSSPKLTSTNEARGSPCSVYQGKPFAMLGGDRKCFSPPSASKILFIDDSDDG